jgi:hypothetical protein
MKGKILGIGICMLLITTTIVTATTIDAEINIGLTSYVAEVPVWEKGDSWTYEMEQIVRSDLNETMAYTLTCDLVLSVVDDTGDYYTLEGIGEPVSAIGNIGKLGLKNSRLSSFNVDLVVRKSDLAVSSYSYLGKGIFFVMLGPIIIPFPIQLAVWRNSEFTPDRSILPFPLYDGKNGTFDSVLIEEDWGTTMYFGLITVEAGNVSWHSTANDYNCTAELITVPAGIFNAYNVSIANQQWNHIFLHYNATVGNAVKISTQWINGDWHDWWLLQEMELKSTTYVP